MADPPIPNFPAAFQGVPHSRLAAPVSAGYVRLWKMMMSARVLLALALLALDWALAAWNGPLPRWVPALCALYLANAAAVRLLAQPRGSGRAFDSQSLYIVGADLICFLPLNLQFAGSINFTPLLAFPILEAAILGSRALAMSVAALVALLLAGDGLIETSRADWAHTTELVQAALTGLALLVLGWLTSHLAGRLAREEVRARRSWDEARIQALVNGMVIESLPDGILVVDPQHTVHAGNPAAYQLLGSAQMVTPQVFNLDDEPAWRELAELADQTFSAGSHGVADITLALPGQHDSHLRVRTERTPALGAEGRSLCVMFLQDMRALQAQLRTEKLAAMGRMSAAVAHEIRTPLAAIAQANALLAEDVPNAAAQRLTAIVRQNAERLGHIVDDILDVARARSQQGASGERLCAPLDALALEACLDWSRQHAAGPRLAVAENAPDIQVQFLPEHLRRVLINLLDNAARYASQRPGAIQVETRAADGPPLLCVWSDGAPLEPSVQRHLFEPFFSSESRSSGLGLYICRELCERHDAAIAYERASRVRDGETAEGNAFRITFRRALAGMSDDAAPAVLDDSHADGQNPTPA
ncbi:MAG: PAS domain-containing sensor histidine kinase [Burkholderiaceae bacterium]|jgi:two-component system sensor histidine kinase PilS (NtrC family)|nr:PAS domain-containing sensor histidine kinase [Burkholderiaceae bacterium]